MIEKNATMSVALQPYKKIMVANRGEIAIRVLRAASELQLRTVAIFTYEDRYSLHRYKADEAYQIGKDDEPLQPYLDIEEIIRVAQENGVEAIHPGYGFLSENVAFARACREAGIVFIGPEPEVMERLGDKVAAKKLAREQGVPLIEDSQEALLDENTALAEARRIGFPVIIKSAAGGGGRGMRVVRDEAQIGQAFNEARGEAGAYFSDDTVFLEKLIDNPKHIEVQILGDKHGHIVHLFERDCSVQRRFQKVVEIAPCISIKETTRQKLLHFALRLCRAVGYSHAGTVEFLVDKEENIYFIEVNPRIQVEHTVTEELTGIDIVRSQILVSMGYPLEHPEINIRSQDDVRIFGCAIQCRVTTEDPSNNFKPDYGRLIAYRSASGMGIRLDAGSAYPGAKISPFFDSLLVKVTAWGRTLPGAAQRMHRALREFRIRGVKTNVGFLLNLLTHPDFQSGEATVNFIQNNPQLLTPPGWRDRGTKLLRYLANIIVNGNPDVAAKGPAPQFFAPAAPRYNSRLPKPNGSRQRLLALGPEGFAQWLKQEKAIHYTDTTFRDAHQSLLATRVRTYDLLRVADSFAQHHGDKVFSMEVWGHLRRGAAFSQGMPLGTPGQAAGSHTQYLLTDVAARLQCRGLYRLPR
jgi:pyruvate carboxylase